MRTFARPHALWWVLILGGLGLLVVLIHCDAAYNWWCEHITDGISREVMWGIWISTAFAHVLEARHAHRLAVRHGLHQVATAWTLQTLMLGYPSLRLLTEVCKSRGANQ